MALLLHFKGEGWDLEITGRSVTLPSFINPQPTTNVKYKGNYNIQVEVYDAKSGFLTPVNSNTDIYPLFFENHEYDFYLSTDLDNVTLKLPPSSVNHHKVKSFQHYSINFQNSVGWFDFIISDNNSLITISCEVFPIKVDYRNDYILMRDEVAEISRSLILSVQSRTYGVADLLPSNQPTLLEWISIIDHYFDKLMILGRAIARNPHSQLIKSNYYESPDRARAVNEKALRREMRSVGSPRNTHGLEKIFPRTIPCISKRTSYDTPENRYLKNILVDIRINLRKIVNTNVSGDEDSDFTAEQKFFEAIRPRANYMLRELETLIRNSFLQFVKDTPPQRPTSLVYHAHPYYALFAKTARLLNSGLSLSGETINIGIKDISLLYEYWCFLKIVKILRENLSLEQQNIVKIKRTRATLVLSKGEESTVVFKDISTGKRYFLVYNKVFNRTPTTPQKPDNIIQLSRDNSVFVLDAKYRLSYDNDYIFKYKGVGPTTDDINTMHRYRDAIVILDKSRRNDFIRGIVKGAVVLFPYNNEWDYSKHKFLKSIQSVLIGGIPFLPSATNLAKAFLIDLINERLSFPSLRS